MASTETRKEDQSASTAMTRRFPPRCDESPTRPLHHRVPTGGTLARRPLRAGRQILWGLRAFPDLREPCLADPRRTAAGRQRLRSRGKRTTPSGSWRGAYGLFVPDVC
jgi:hypothetical protein